MGLNILPVETTLFSPLPTHTGEDGLYRCPLRSLRLLPPGQGSAFLEIQVSLWRLPLLAGPGVSAPALTGLPTPLGRSGHAFRSLISFNWKKCSCVTGRIIGSASYRSGWRVSFLLAPGGQQWMWCGHEPFTNGCLFHGPFKSI